MPSLLLSPHDDDSVLFASFICMREKPIVLICTDSYIQPLRGEIGCGHELRQEETKRAHEILGVATIRLGVHDNLATEKVLADAMSGFDGFETVFAPALQGGNKDHDAVYRAATRLFRNIRYYTTYSNTQLCGPACIAGEQEIVPTEEEMNLKLKALNCYRSQLNLPSTLPHFQAVIGKSEWATQ